MIYLVSSKRQSTRALVKVNSQAFAVVQSEVRPVIEVAD